MNSIDYLNSLHKPLSNDELSLLMNDKEKNKDTIVRAFIPLVINSALQFNLSTNVDVQHFISNGLLEISNAISKYDESKNNLPAYLKKCVMNRMIKTIETGDIIKISKYLKKIKTHYPIALSFSNFTDDENIDSVDASIEYNENEIVKRLQDNLTPFEAHIVIERCGITGETKTNKELAHSNSMKQSVTSYTYTNAIKKLKPIVKKITK